MILTSAEANSQKLESEYSLFKLKQDDLEVSKNNHFDLVYPKPRKWQFTCLDRGIADEYLSSKISELINLLYIK